MANIVFTAIFSVEMLLKWVAIGPRSYFSDSWNVFDAFIVAVSVLGAVIENTTSASLAFLTLLRIMRVARIFRVIPKARGLRMMLLALRW
jgi:hypothetical protein